MDDKNNKIIKNIIIILTPILILILLASMIFAIFNGIIGITETVLDQALQFITDPIGFVSELLRHAHNTWVTAFRRK